MPGGERIRSTERIYPQSFRLDLSTDLPSGPIIPPMICPPTVCVCAWYNNPKLYTTSYVFPPANTSQGGWPGRGRGASHLRGLPRPGGGAAHGVELFGLKIDPDRSLPGLRRQRVAAAATLHEVREACPITYRKALRYCVILPG